MESTQLPQCDSAFNEDQHCRNTLLCHDRNGIIKDYGSRVVLRGRSATDTRVQEIMTSPVVTVTLDATVFECMAIMTRNHIRHLPVSGKGELVGVVSMGDLARAVISDQAFKIDQLMTYVGQK